MFSSQMPKFTRLRFVSANKPEQIELFLSALKQRVQIMGAPVFDGKVWYLYFVPGDTDKDIKSVRLENVVK